MVLNNITLTNDDVIVIITLIFGYRLMSDLVDIAMERYVWKKNKL